MHNSLDTFRQNTVQQFGVPTMAGAGANGVSPLLAIHPGTTASSPYACRLPGSHFVGVCPRR